MARISSHPMQWNGKDGKGGGYGTSLIIWNEDIDAIIKE